MRMFYMPKTRMTVPLGPFCTEESFNEDLVDGCMGNSGVSNIDLYIRGMLESHKHKIVFTHGTFRPKNIIIENGRVAAIIGWRAAGWYPEYWEFARALDKAQFENNWDMHILNILKPYYCEQLMHQKILDTIFVNISSH